jgi:exodeoxyribonuclease V beta subunit
MDRVGRGSNQKESIIYEYEGIELQNLYLRTKGRESLDAAYAKALQKENALEREDSLNALYVAFTRAKENLFIIQKEKSSAFGIVELSVMQRGELLVEPTPKVVHKSHLPLVYEELYYGTQSDLLATQKSEQEDLSAISFGLALHYMLEMMETFDEVSIESAKMLLLNKYGATLSADEMADITSRVRMLVNNKAFLELSDGVCFREKALRYKKNLRYLDLLVKKEDGSYVIVDYKSATTHADEHKKQVASYVHAVKSITKESRVSGYLCYLLQKEIRLVQV